MAQIQQGRKRIIDHNELSDHEKKNLLILDIIRRKGPISRADIARQVDLNNVTVTSYVDQYLRKKVLHEAGVHISTGGRKPTLVDIDAEIAYAVGVGLNAADYIAILCDLKGNTLHKAKIKRDAQNNEKPVETIIQLIKLLLAESKVDAAKIHGIGIGVPGMVNHRNGTVRWPKGLLSGDLSISVSISNNIQQQIGIPVILDNDANTAVFGEQWTAENGLDVESAAYLYSGSGCGLMINGHIHRGHTGTAGEFLFDLDREDPIAWLSEAVNTGGWAIDLGITQRAREEAKKHKDSKLYKLLSETPDQVDLEAVTDAAESGEEYAAQILREAGMVLGHKAALIVNLLNPEIIIIGGGVETAGIIFLDGVRSRIKEVAVPEAAEKIKVVPSQL
ncbi:MAG: ROK family protein, partial [Candidatus Omnitrophica bacterium]|nr:ROK family protein [Candidatus Omnitrophota bacterium]